MTLQEFIDRTDFMPIESEWDTIQEAYMLSPLNKDQFCRLWRKTNRGRIEKERERMRYYTKLESKMSRMEFKIKENAESEWYGLLKEHLGYYLLRSEKPLFFEKVLNLRKGQQETFNCAFGSQIHMLCK